MKILAVGSAILPDPNKQSQVDIWRVFRPMRELAKHTNWQIDFSPSFIQGFEKYQKLEEFTEVEMEKAFKQISKYDIVFASYHPDPTAYTMLKVARDKAGTQFVMDCDDDMFAINPDNPFWMKIEHEQVYWMQRMIADNEWITTPSPVLAERFKKRRELDETTVNVIPNYIADDYKHPKFDNGDKIVIGYCGGSSHYRDLHESGVLEAVQKLMHENKNIYFKSVGMVVDTYLPRARVEFDGGKRGSDYLDKIYPNLNFDIALGPILDNLFNWGKSNIKWQESTRAGAAFVGSNLGPYKQTLEDGKNALLVKNNSDDWYRALKRLVDNKELRKKILTTAQKDLKDNWRLEDNWVKYQQLFERIAGKNESKPTPLGRSHTLQPTRKA
jgi:glycosyltransferase involved in cell wall biosynthesis